MRLFAGWMVVLLVTWCPSAVASSGWPWTTTPDECVHEYETLAQGKGSLGLIHAACRWAYADQQSDQDRYKGGCIIDRIDEPKSEVAFMVLANRCREEAEAKHPNPFDGFD